MYTPQVFRKDNIDELHQMVLKVGAATIISAGTDGLIASHAPIELDPSSGQFGAFRFHLARANPHVDALQEGTELLFIFQGPQRYITPSWYPSKQHKGEGVPTWNYVAVHGHGAVKPLANIEALKRHLKSMSRQFESEFSEPWKFDDAPSDYIDRMCKAIIGFEVALNRLEGKWKMSQNRLAEDRRGVVSALRQKGDDNSLMIAEMVENYQPD